MKSPELAKQNIQNIPAFAWGGLIGLLGGLIGLGGAEFRLPVLVGVFKYRTLKAIVINLVVSLITVVASFIFRAGYLHLDRLTAHWNIILNILSGSLLGAYAGVHFAARINERVLQRVVIVLLMVLSLVLISYNFIVGVQNLQIPGSLQIVLAFAAGIIIGGFSSLLGVAGGELIIPTILLLFALDIKLAGSLSLAISAPTILIGLLRYGNQGKLAELQSEIPFILWMSLGSIAGAFIGSYFLQYAPSSLLHVLLGLILFTSAIKLMREQKHSPKTA
jgi:uncharacterized membrane protein YfcA